MLDTSKFDGKEEVKEYVSKWLGKVGIYKVKINSVEAKVSSTGSPDFIFNVETEPLDKNTYPDFVPDEKATHGGQTGKVTYGVYIGNDKMWDDFGGMLSVLATKLNVKEVLDMKVNSVQSEDKTEYANQLAQKLTETFEGTGFFWMRVTGKKYAKTDKNGNPAEGVILTISRYGAFATLVEGKDHLKPVDENNTYDLKPVPTAPVGNGAVSY